jgi:hypothetical protein
MRAAASNQIDTFKSTLNSLGDYRAGLVVLVDGVLNTVFEVTGHGDYVTHLS